MSAMKRHLEDMIERTSNESGYPYNFLMDTWNAMQETGEGCWMDLYDMAVEHRTSEMLAIISAVE